MKRSTFWVTLVFTVIISVFSCSKENNHTPDSPQKRNVQFVLYTDTTFPNENSLITFTLSIANASNKTLWDSMFLPMQLKDIPDLPHRIMVTKTVPDNDTSLLKVGFYYTIENVGYSWKLDTFSNRAVFKSIEFNFR